MGQLRDSSFPFQISLDKIKEFVRHNHQHHEMFFVSAGSALHRIGDKGFLIKSGDIVLLTPDIVHEFKEASPDFTIYNCIFAPSLLTEHKDLVMNMRGFLDLFYVEAEKQGYKYMSLTGRAELKVRAITEDLLSEYTNHYPGYKMAIKAMLVDMLVTVTRAYSAIEGRKTATRAEKIIEAVRFIDLNYVSKLDLETVAARKAGVSKEYFCVIFKRITGKTFTEYINYLRVEHAVRLLASSDKKISDAALESGFNDISYFNRVFREQKGHTPKAFRKAD